MFGTIDTVAGDQFMNGGGNSALIAQPSGFFSALLDLDSAAEENYSSPYNYLADSSDAASSPPPTPDIISSFASFPPPFSAQPHELSPVTYQNLSPPVYGYNGQMDISASPSPPTVQATR